MPTAKLSRKIIAAKAAEMLDNGEGLSSLSMRKLGAELGVEAMSLYHYVDNKADLLDSVMAVFLNRVELPEIDPENWEEAVKLGCTSFYELLEASPAALELIAGQPPASPESLAVSYFGVAAFETFGLTTKQATIALHTALSFVVGHSAFKGGSMAANIDPSKVDELVGDDTQMRSYVETASNTTRVEQFEEGLDIVIAGLRAQYGLK